MVPHKTPARTDRFELCFIATELEARGAIGSMMTRLAMLGLPANRAGDIQLVLAEALNNVVEHAYEGAGIGNVVVRCTLDPGCLELRIADIGKPLPGGVLPAAEFPDLAGPMNTLPEGGFGWCLIHELTSSVQYRRDGDCNYLSLGFELL